MGDIRMYTPSKEGATVESSHHEHLGSSVADVQVYRETRMMLPRLPAKRPLSWLVRRAGRRDVGLNNDTSKLNKKKKKKPEWREGRKEKKKK